MRPLCPLADIPQGQTRAFPHPQDYAPGFFAIRQADKVLAYRNACPHLGVPLDWLAGRFLSADGTMIICATHGAEFRIEDGFCTRGPCRGQHLTPIPCTIQSGMVLVAEDAGL